MKEQLTTRSQAGRWESVASGAAVTIGTYTGARLGPAAGITDDLSRITVRAPIDFAAFARDRAEAWRRPGDDTAA